MAVLSTAAPPEKGAPPPEDGLVVGVFSGQEWKVLRERSTSLIKKAKNRERCLEHSRRRLRDLCRKLAGEIPSDSHEEGPTGPNFAMEIVVTVRHDLGKNLGTEEEVVFNLDYLVNSLSSLESKDMNQWGSSKGIAKFSAGGIPSSLCEDGRIGLRGNRSPARWEGNDSDEMGVISARDSKALLAILLVNLSIPVFSMSIQQDLIVFSILDPALPVCESFEGEGVFSL